METALSATVSLVGATAPIVGDGIYISVREPSRAIFFEDKMTDPHAECMKFRWMG